MKKINIENYLYRLDQIFSAKTKKDIYLLYIMIVAVIIGVSYALFFTPSSESLNSTHNKVLQMQRLVNEDNSYLNANPPAKLLQLDKEVEQLKQRYSTYKNDNRYIRYRIAQISPLFYNEKTWGTFLNSISLDAKKYDIKLLKYSNTYTKHEVSFGHVLDINLTMQGGYKNTLKFINALEQSFLIVDIHNISMRAKEHLTTALQISVWGIKH
jgi:Tfp pilus assembly protein PilO